jgi:hypothetical protein
MSRKNRVHVFAVQVRFNMDVEPYTAREAAKELLKSLDLDARPIFREGDLYAEQVDIMERG